MKYAIASLMLLAVLLSGVSPVWAKAKGDCCQAKAKCCKVKAACCPKK